MAALVNRTVENIGARRLHTVLERIVEVGASGRLWRRWGWWDRSVIDGHGCPLSLYCFCSHETHAPRSANNNDHHRKSPSPRRTTRRGAPSRWTRPWCRRASMTSWWRATCPNTSCDAAVWSWGRGSACRGLGLAAGALPLVQNVWGWEGCGWGRRSHGEWRQLLGNTGRCPRGSCWFWGGANTQACTNNPVSPPPCHAWKCAHFCCGKGHTTRRTFPPRWNRSERAAPRAIRGA